MKSSQLIEASLHQVVHARTGDKGNRINIAVLCYHDDAYPYLVEQLTEARVRACFAHRQPSAVQRYLVPNLSAINYVMDDVLAGGVNSSLFLDRHGKGLSSLLLTLMVRVPAHCVTAL